MFMFNKRNKSEKPVVTPPVGVTMLDIADLPDTERQIVQHILRTQGENGLTLAQLKTSFPMHKTLERLLTSLTTRAFLVQRTDSANSPCYRVNLQAKRPRSGSIADKLFG